MLRTLITLALAGFLATSSGCAGHQDLKAPCASEKIAGWFGLVAFADDGRCGPLVRQTGVIVF